MTKKAGEFTYPNYYETLDEAHRRLLGTVVAYDGEPVTILAITNHKADGIYRAYIWPTKMTTKVPASAGFGELPAGSPQFGVTLDAWLDKNKDSGLMRKHLNSPAFNRFRPFPLGMLNTGGGSIYLERTPERRTYQGLTRSAIRSVTVNLTVKKERRECPVHLYGPEFTDCVKAAHPKAEEVLENMLRADNGNTAVACHRDFAIIRGPLDTFYLGHKDKVVGFVPPTKRPEVELGKGFSYLKETVEELKQFTDIRVRV